MFNVITCGSYKKIWESLEQVVVSDEQNPNISNMMWSHMEMFGFCTSDITTCSKFFQIFIIGSSCDNMTPQPVS